MPLYKGNMLRHMKFSTDFTTGGKQLFHFPDFRALMGHYLKTNALCPKRISSKATQIATT